MSTIFTEGRFILLASHDLSVSRSFVSIIVLWRNLRPWLHDYTHTHTRTHIHTYMHFYCVRKKKLIFLSKPLLYKGTVFHFSGIHKVLSSRGHCLRKPQHFISSNVNFNLVTTAWRLFIELRLKTTLRHGKQLWIYWIRDRGPLIRCGLQVLFGERLTTPHFDTITETELII
jgi:hypothetical protein